MSLARIYTTKKSRKVWTCDKCRKQIPVGSKVLSFTVGFRGFERKRCDDPSCFPANSERESSALATVYAAIEQIDIESLDSFEDIESAVQEVVDALSDVISEYESNQMFDINYDLQDRVDSLQSSLSILENWSSNVGNDEPDDEEEREAWVTLVRDAAQEAIDSIEFP